MRDTRRGKIGLLVGVMALVGSIMVPGTVAQSETVREELGVLRLHLDNGVDQRYFRFDEGADGSYAQGIPQLINGSCPVTSLPGPQWVSLTGGSTSFTTNRVGLSNNGLGVRFLNCGRVDAPSWALRIKLGTELDLLDPSASGIGVDRAELDLQGWGGVTVVADLYLDGAKLPVDQQPTSPPFIISGNGTRARMVIDRTGLSIFDEIRLHPAASFDSVALRGGGLGSPIIDGSLGDALDTGDSLFRVVSETTTPSLSITKTPTDNIDQVLAGDTVGYTITVTNASGAGTASNVVVTDDLTNDLSETGLVWTVAPGSACIGATIVDGVLTCPLGSMPGDGVPRQIFVTSETTEGEAIGAITNFATVTADDVPPLDSATASIFVGAHTLVCGEPDSDDVGNVTLTLQADGSCAPIVYTITFEDNELLVQKLDDDVVIKVEIDAWDPERVETPVPATVVTPPEPNGEEVVWCLGTELAPEMPPPDPNPHNWCLIKQSTVTYGPDGTDPDWVPDYEGQLMQVTETLLFVGDPGAKRR